MSIASTYTTTTKLAAEKGYPVWAVRRAVDELGVAERFDGRIRAIPRSKVDRVVKWLESRNISRVEKPESLAPEVC